MKRILCLLAVAPLFAENYYLHVAGLGGEPDYEKRFTQLAMDLAVLTAPAGKTESLAGTQAAKANLKAALDRIAAAAKSDDTFTFTLIGHGTWDGAAYKFNVPGPDVTADELRAWLAKISARQLVIVATSSSGAALATLRAPNRVVITATKSGTEKNAVVFSRYWVDGLRDASADSDRNDLVTALEAFKFAEQKTVRFYESANRLATEHPLLEDTGKGEGVRAPGPDNGEGLIAGRFPLLRVGTAQQAFRDPAKQALLKRKEELEEKIDQLKYEKAALPLDEYKKRLQVLLTELATVQEVLERP